MRNDLSNFIENYSIQNYNEDYNVKLDLTYKYPIKHNSVWRKWVGNLKKYMNKKDIFCDGFVISEYDRNNTLDYNQKNVSIQEFINHDLIHFSNSDNIRSVPSAIDGLKPSQRKVLYCAFKRKLDKEIDSYMESCGFESVGSGSGFGYRDKHYK